MWAPCLVLCLPRKRLRAFWPCHISWWEAGRAQADVDADVYMQAKSSACDTEIKAHRDCYAQEWDELPAGLRERSGRFRGAGIAQIPVCCCLCPHRASRDLRRTIKVIAAIFDLPVPVLALSANECQSMSIYPRQDCDHSVR